MAKWVCVESFSSEWSKNESQYKTELWLLTAKYGLGTYSLWLYTLNVIARSIYIAGCILCIHVYTTGSASCNNLVFWEKEFIRNSLFQL